MKTNFDFFGNIKERRPLKSLDSAGVTLVELVIALVIIALTAQAAVMLMTVTTKQSLSAKDKVFAQSKSDQIFNELQSYAQMGRIISDYNDGSNYSLILTADKSVSNPGDPLSGNIQNNGHWRYLRQVQVAPVTINTPFQNMVIVDVLRCESDGTTLTPGVLLAVTKGMM